MSTEYYIVRNRSGVTVAHITATSYSKAMHIMFSLYGVKAITSMYLIKQESGR